MSYIDGFVIAVPTANKQAFIAHAREFDPVFVEFGALRIVEGWGDDVPAGKLTDFRRAVQAKDDETVVFSWIEWPDKATRDEGMKKVMSDPRMDPARFPMPFDGKRMVYGGFSPVVEMPAVPAPARPAVQPYLFFRGRCEEAIAFYKDKLGAEVLMMMRFKEAPDKPPSHLELPPDVDERVMHACLDIHGTNVMMSDGMASGPLDFNCMSLSITVPDAASAKRIFDGLADGGSVQMPLGPTFFSPCFGAVADKFGVSWMVIVQPEGG